MVKKILEDYMGYKFDIFQRANIIDIEMKYLHLFKTGADEFDIVSIFKKVTPKMPFIKDDFTSFPMMQLLSLLKSKVK